MTNYWNEWPSNFSNGQSVTGIGSFLNYSNVATGGVLSAIILLLIFGISFLTLKQYSFEKAFAASFFVTTAISILLMRMSMVAVPVVISLAVITVVAILLVRKETTAMGL